MNRESLTGDEPATLQSRLEAAGDDRVSADEATIDNPAALLQRLDVSGHFHRDSPFGRVFHRGMISLRENVATDSLHVSVDGNALKAHVDKVSPLTRRSDGTSGYSLRRALSHNLVGMAHDALWLLRGRQGDHACDLDCEWVPHEGRRALRELDLLDPSAGAWSVQLEVRVAGTFDDARMRAALGAALGPAIPQRDPLDVVACDDDACLDAARARLQGTVVPASHCPPLHVCLAHHPAGDVLMLSLNHAAVDGFGALEVLQSIARAYAGDADPRAPLEFLATRDLPLRPAPPVTSGPRRVYKRSVERVRNLRDRPARLSAAGTRDEPGCGFHLVALSADETQRVVGVDHGRANTNVLVAALHLAIGEWNRRHAARGRRIGVLVHADLRPPEWGEKPIANFSVTARMSTDRGERDGAASALETISAQIERNKRTRTGVALIAALERAGLLALWARQSIVVLQPLTGNMVDTTVLCNLGWLDGLSFGAQAGEASELWFSVPARAPLSLSVGAVTIGGRLHLTFRHPHRLFGPAAARRFAECYLDELRRVADVRS